MIAGGWRIAAASAVGSSHLKSGRNCDDAFRCAVSARDGTAILVVADGAGSARHAALGASLACNETIRLCLGWLEGASAVPLDTERLRQLAPLVGEHLAARARDDGVPVRELACTLLVAVLGPATTLFGQVGDGAIVFAAGAGWDWAFWPQHGEFANTTNFVTEADAGDRFEVREVAGAVPEIALFSDGLEGLLLHQASRSVHAPFFDTMFAPVRQSTADGLDGKLSAQLATYLDSKAIRERTDDDTTLLLATRRSGPDGDAG